jgi:hypothetical protein
MTTQKFHGNEQGRERTKGHRHRRHHKVHVHNPCPHAPRQLDSATELNGVFNRHHGHKRHNHWKADLHWVEVNVDSDGFPLNVNGYDVELEISGNGTDWFTSSRHKVPAKDDGDPNDKVHITIHHIHGRLAYRYHVRATSKSCKAEWSDYFVIGTPEDAPPAPNDVRILRASHGIRLKWHSRPDDHDDELFDERVAHSIAELWTNEDFGPVKAFTATASDDKFTVTSHGFNDGDPVMVSQDNVDESNLIANIFSALPLGVKPWKLYLVDSKTTHTFKLVDADDLSPINLSLDGTGLVHWGLVRKSRHNHHHHHFFRLDVPDFSEDTRFYGRVKNVSDHRSSSAWIPATAPGSNDDPDATPTGRRPAWHRHVFTFTFIGDVSEGVYPIPDRSDDDYEIRRVTVAFNHKAGGGAPTRFDVKINGSTFVFDGDNAKMPKVDDGEHDGHSNNVVNGTLERGDFIRAVVDSIEGDPPGNGTMHVICDRIQDGSTSDSGGGGGD